MRLFQTTYTSEGNEVGRWWVRAESAEDADRVMIKIANFKGAGLDPREARPASDFQSPKHLKDWLASGVV